MGTTGWYLLQILYQLYRWTQRRENLQRPKIDNTRTSCLKMLHISSKLEIEVIIFNFLWILRLAKHKFTSSNFSIPLLFRPGFTTTQMVRMQCSVGILGT